ncbi:MAG: hypothetical protein COV35_11175 [Alphaproteobacteria bacterium CG11_big_fil_rev_8_21_14_0_20_39_49]|nr:MAG: hypothetical protein COV35_11175 [Alphaproteobacteria bacterium CG11_big_fil_rev_8_21_14_0_20_39_49]
MKRLHKQDVKKLTAILTKLQDDAPKLFDDEAVEQFKKAVYASVQEEVSLDMSLNKHGESLLHIAATSDKTTKEDINFLISQAGLSPERRSNHGYTPLDNAMEAYSSNLENTDANNKTTVDYSVADTLIKSSSLQTFKKPSNENHTLFHILSEIPAADKNLYKTAMDRLEGITEDERIGILQSKNKQNKTILDRLMLQGNTDAIDIIYSSLPDKEKPKFIIHGINSELFGDFKEDVYKFYIEKYKQVADYQVSYTEIDKKDEKVTFKPDEAAALADLLERSIEPNKNKQGYGSEEKVRGMISELRETSSLQGGVNRNLADNLSGTTLLNLAIGMHDRKSFDVLSKYGADFNNRETNNAKVLPIEAAIDAHARSRSGNDRKNYKKAAKAILEQTLEKSDIDSIVNARTELETNQMQYIDGLVLSIPTAISSHRLGIKFSGRTREGFRTS